MAKIPENIRDIIEDYLRDLGSEIKIEKVVLFGSYAKGTYSEDSDIDLEPISFTKQNYEERIGFVQEVLKDGIELNVN